MSNPPGAEPRDSLPGAQSAEPEPEPADGAAGLLAALQRLRQLVLPEPYLPEVQRQFEQHMLAHIRRVSLALGMTGVFGSALGVFTRMLIDGAAYTPWRLYLLLPVTLLLAVAIYRSPTVRFYGVVAPSAAGVITFNAYLGSIGMAHPLMQFLPGLMIVVLAISFFWVNFAQWLAGTAACYAPVLFFMAHGVERNDAIYGGLYLVLTLGASFAAHCMTLDYRRRTFNQEMLLAERSTTDELTGIHNRRQFLHLAARMGERLQQAGLPLCMLYLDIDHFKSLNDRFGHAAGDRALQALAGAVQALVRPQDTVGRLGGEEFAVALPECTLDDGLRLAERLRAGLALLDRPDGKLSVSIGVAQRQPGESLYGLLHRADMAMLQAKESGRNAVRAAPAA